MSTSTAERLGRLIENVLGVELPLRVRAWDGSERGPHGTPVVVVRSRRALRHLLWSPGELGLARAYVTGDLDIEGDLATGLRRVWSAGAQRPPLRRLVAAAPALLRAGAIGPRPPRPSAEAHRRTLPDLRGRRHTKRRDRAAISHHYDLSNEFYELILDPSMAYSCASWRVGPEAGETLEQAQRAKLDLVCTKLGLRDGSHLVDVGCGWGSLTLLAAEHYGARVTAITLSHRQRDLVEARAAERRLAERVDVTLQHVRDLDVGDADAVASIEMGEHVGDEEYADFASRLAGFVRPGGRVLIQQMSRADVAPGGGAFIETYIAPDMHMKPLHRTLEHLEAAGLEIRHVEALREHYPLTVAAWAATLERRWAEAVALVGEETARAWRLYLAGGALAFEQRRMGVDQVLAVRPDADGSAHMPLSPWTWRGVEAPAPLVE